MKAISPMIAIVMLIAFTVAVGGIISVWLTTFTGTQTGVVERGAAGVAECGGVYIKIENVDETATEILVSNPSKQKIYVTAMLDDTGATNTTSPDFGAIESGGLKVIDTTNIPASGAKKVTVKGFCEAAATNITIEGVCEKGSPCW